MNDWYISDNHFQHNNIIKYTGRTQFMRKEELEQYNKIMCIQNDSEQREAMKKLQISKESTDIHDEVQIKKWNERVAPEDRVWYGGDFCFTYEGSKRPSYFIERLNGKIIFITGNHDRKKRNGLNSKAEAVRLRDGGWLIWMTHDPRHIRFDCDINFCGHVHKKWQFARIDKNAGLGQFGEPKINTTKAKPNYSSIVDVVNLSVDVWDFYPQTIASIKKMYWRWRNAYESGMIGN